MRQIAVLLFLFAILCNSNAQIVVTGQSDNTNVGAQQLVDFLMGGGVAYSNVHYCGTPASNGTHTNKGTFTGGLPLIGITSGVVLSTGTVIDLPNNNGNSSTDWTTSSGDAELNSIADVTPAYDPIGLCFDFVPEGNQISFKYVFGSDEYPEYIGTGVNDAFGFFISGPNPLGGNYNWVNIALLGNGQPVTIDNAPFNDNNSGSVPIECDGYTNVMTASKAVNACQTYQMKIILGDVGDHIIDTWVFLEKESFVSPSVDHIDISYSSPAAGNNAIEGCNNVILDVHLGAVTPIAHNIPISITGSAVYGTDYTTTPALGGTAPNFFITIPAGQSSAIVTIIPVADGLTEGVEDIQAQFQVNVCPPYQYIYHSFNILDYSPPTLTVSDTVTICPGSSASINAVLTGGTTPYSYTWAPGGSTNSTITVNPAVTTTYTVSASDICGIAQTDNVVVNVTGSAAVQVSITANPSGPICSTTPVTFTAIPVNGGTTPQYQWQVNGSNVGTNSPTFTSSTLQNGDVVQCILTSNSGCATGNPATSNQITMIYGATPTASISAGGPTSICQGSTVLLSASPIGSNYTYQWTLNGTNIPGATSQTLNVSNAGNYQVQVTDACGTGTSAPITIVVNPTAPAVITPAGPTTICQGTSVTLNANTGSNLTYQWQLNYNNIPNATSSSYQANQSGTYSVVVTNSCGPSTSAPVYVTVIDPPVASIAANGLTTFCHGGYVQIQGTPCTGCTYQWFYNGDSIANGLYANYWAFQDGIFTQTVSNSCFSTTSNAVTIHVIQPAPVTCTITATPNGPICYGTSVVFNANGANGGANPSYLWYINGISTGNSAPVYSSSTLNNGDIITCVFTSSDTCVTGSPATSNSITMSVSQIQPVTVSVTTTPPLPVCDGQQITFNSNVTNGGTNPTYAWFVNGVFMDNGSSYSTNTLTNGDIITCQVTSNANCITGNPATSTPITYSENPNLPVSVVISQSPQNPVCAGALVTFVATPTNGGGNPSYQWQVNGNNVGTNSSMYQSAFLNNNDQITCILTSSAACISGNPATSLPLILQIRALPSVNAGPDQVSCYGNTLPTSITGATVSNQNTISWSHNGSGTLTGNTTLAPQYAPSAHDTIQGQVTLTVIATNECGTSSDEMVLDVKNRPRVYAGTNDTLCEKNFVTLPESFAFNYTWLDWSTSGTGYFTDTTILHPRYYFSVYDKDTAGWVNLTIEAGSICGSAYDTLKVFWSENPVMTVSHDTTINLGDEAIMGAWGAQTYYWFPDSMITCNVCPNPIATPDSTKTYVVIGINKFGCRDVDSVTVHVNYVDAIFIPNAFTPNNDGHNDILYVRGIGIRHIDFKVFDRWGQKVFESQNQKEGWNGTYHGEECNQGVYTWILEAYLKDNSRIFKKGNITLVR